MSLSESFNEAFLEETDIETSSIGATTTPLARIFPRGGDASGWKNVWE
jgi:hypothetical protein